MLIFVLPIIIGLFIMFVPARFFKNNRLLLVLAKILGIALIAIGIYFIYGIHTERISFPFN